MMFLGDGQGTAVFVAGGEEGDCGFSLHLPQIFCVSLCKPQARGVEELHRGVRMTVE